MREHGVNANGTGACYGAWMAHAEPNALMCNVSQRIATPVVNRQRRAAPLAAGQPEAGSEARVQADTPPIGTLVSVRGSVKSVCRFLGGAARTWGRRSRPGCGSGFGRGYGQGGRQ